MCVIFICDKKRPSLDMIEKAWDANDHGAGIAWREDSDVIDDRGKPRKLVHWMKGLDYPTVKELVNEVPLPFVVHFRIASCGGTRPALTHPFPIEVDVPQTMEGDTFGHVLFHNGHWSKWEEQLFDIARNFREKIPSGKWSDSRALAWFAAHYGVAALECVKEKIVAFSPEEIEIFSNGTPQGANAWQEIEGVMCSNSFFQTRGQGGWVGTGHGNLGNYAGTMCRDRSCTRKDIDTDGYCPAHQDQKPAQLRAKHVEKHTEKEACQERVLQVKPETTGGSSTETPFGVVTLERFELLRQAGKISKKTLNRARALFALVKELPETVN